MVSNDYHSGARYTIYVPAVNIELSARKHTLEEKMLKPIALSFVAASIVSKQALSVICLQTKYFFEEKSE